MTPTVRRPDGLARLAHTAQGRGQHPMAHALREFAELARHTPYAACELLAASKQLEKQGEPARAAMLAWLCRDDFPEAAADAAALLHRIDTLIPGVLFGDHLVWVSSRALAA